MIADSGVGRYLKMMVNEGWYMQVFVNFVSSRQCNWVNNTCDKYVNPIQSTWYNEAVDNIS